MALSDDLVAYYSMEENFDEAFQAENSVPPNAMPLLSINDPSAGTGLIYIHSVAGKIGLAAQGTESASSVALQSSSEHAIAIMNGDKTFSFWVRLDTARQEDAFLVKGAATTEYAFGVDGTGKWRLSSSTQAILHPDVPEVGVWYFIVFWYDSAAGLAYIKVNDGLPTSGAFTPVLQAGTKLTAVTGALTMDELGIWDRILTADEQRFLYNEGDGIGYDDIDVAALTAASDCREVECCDDVVGDYAATAGAGKGFDSVCEPLPKVLFEPTSGTPLIFPSLVLLRSDNPEAVIHYTTDGTAPNTNSPIYTGAITVESPATVIRAAAIVDACPHGPEALAQWAQWTPAASFTYACTTTDRAGQWGAFAPNGSPDYNWEFQVQFTATAAVKEFTVLQLFSNGKFTGSAWSTKQTIYPWEDDPTKGHLAFPLVIRIGGVQQNSAYHDDYSTGVGTFIAGSYTLDLFGQPWASLPATHVFELCVTFTDGSKLVRIVDTTCDALPPALCPVPVITSLTPACGPYRIDVTYSLTIGTHHTVDRRVAGSGTGFTTLLSGNVVSSPQTFQDTTVATGVTYEYFISNIPTACAVTKFSTIYTAQAIPLATVSISASSTLIGVGQSTTISWNSLNNSGTVDISPTIGAQAGNTPGSQSVSPLVTTTYTITGQNACGTITTAQVTVTVEPTPTCGADSTVVEITGYTNSTFNLSTCSGDLENSAATPWNGRLRSVPPATCVYNPVGVLSINGKALDAATVLGIVGLNWRLSVYADGVIADSYLIWEGTKGYGVTAAGVYTRTGGCSATPATLTVVEVV